jgi:hypothetical protein
VARKDAGYQKQVSSGDSDLRLVLVFINVFFVKYKFSELVKLIYWIRIISDMEGAIRYVALEKSSQLHTETQMNNNTTVYSPMKPPWAQPTSLNGE